MNARLKAEAVVSGIARLAKPGIVTVTFFQVLAVNAPVSQAYIRVELPSMNP